MVIWPPCSVSKLVNYEIEINPADFIRILQSLSLLIFLQLYQCHRKVSAISGGGCVKKRAVRLIESLNVHFGQHPEQAFVAKALSLLLVMQVLAKVFALWWDAIYLLAPIFVWCVLRVASIYQDKSMVRVFLENLTFIPAPYLEDDRKLSTVPWVTYCLILSNVVVHYIAVPNLPSRILENLIFIPRDVTFFNVLVSDVSCMFLHADGWHLWGNMAFLWAMGTVLERRIGHAWLAALYLATGVAANLIQTLIEILIFGELFPGLGASGAISGLMGVYAIRCYFKTIVFPFPVLGFFSYLFPVNLKVRMNALVVIGLFFWSDLSSGIDQVRGLDVENIGYWCHIGGMMVGVLLASRMKLGADAMQEKHLDIARSALSGKNWLGGSVGEKAVREYLKGNPEDTEALLLLAQKVSKPDLTEEGRELYKKTILGLLGRDLPKAVAVYREYFNRYLLPLTPDIQFRLAALIEKEEDLDLAARSLEVLLKEKGLDREFRKKCLFHCARLCKKMSLPDAALMYEQRLNELMGDET